MECPSSLRPQALPFEAHADALGTCDVGLPTCVTCLHWLAGRPHPRHQPGLGAGRGSVSWSASLRPSLRALPSFAGQQHVGAGCPAVLSPLLAGGGPAGTATKAGSVTQPWLLPRRLPPGAGLMERIQAIAQNVSDIAVKVDQLLRHSLILHSKGGSQGAPYYPQEASVLGGHLGWDPDFSHSSCPGSSGPISDFGRVDLGSPTPTWRDGAEDSRGLWRLRWPPSIRLDAGKLPSGVTGPISAPLKKVGYFWVDSWSIATQASSSLGLNP